MPLYFCKVLCYYTGMVNYYAVNEKLRKEIKGALHANGVTHQELADELGKSRIQVTRILNGRSATGFATWEYLAKKAGKQFMLKDIEVK